MIHIHLSTHPRTGTITIHGERFDLATWHLINTVYAPARLAELRGMKSWYADLRHHARLVTAVEERLGHALANAAERAKIDVALTGHAEVDLSVLETGLGSSLHEAQAAPGVPGAWKWCCVVSYFDARWHCAHTALPSARSLPPCGSWQSPQVTPLSCMRLDRNEPQLHTSSRCWPSAWYRPASRVEGR